MADSRIRRILHCDMDCFYAAVHMRDQPELRGRAVVVGGDPERRGVVAAANYEARRFGIHSAMPASEAVRRCPEVVIVRPDPARYRRESRRIFDIYREYTPLVETLSLDEAYLDVTDHLGDFGSATAVASDIRSRVKDATGLTVSIGVGPSKLVAKIASDFEKPDGLTVVPPKRVQAFLDPLPVRRLHGVGPATAERLDSLEVETVRDLRTLSLDTLLAHFGSHGRTLHQFAHGIDERPVRPHRPRKSVGAERTFASDLTTIAEIHEHLGPIITEVARRLADKDLAAATLVLKVRYDTFETITRSRTLPAAVATADEILDVVQALLERTDCGRRPVRLLGVTGAGLTPRRLVQPDLFEW